MAMYRTCHQCGSNLDCGEKCDCQKLNQEKQAEQGGDGNKNTGYALANTAAQEAQVYRNKVGKISGL